MFSLWQWLTRSTRPQTSDKETIEVLREEVEVSRATPTELAAAIAEANRLSSIKK